MPLLSAHSTSQGDPHRLHRAESAQRDAGPFAPFWNSLSHGCPNRVLRSVPAFHPGSAERIPRLSGHARENQRHPPSENGTSELGRSITSRTLGPYQATPWGEKRPEFGRTIIRRFEAMRRSAGKCESADP